MPESSRPAVRYAGGASDAVLGGAARHILTGDLPGDAEHHCCAVAMSHHRLCWHQAARMLLLSPGREVPAFRAAQWFSGEAPFPGPDDAGLLTLLDPWNSGNAAPLAFYRLNDRAAEAELRSTERARTWTSRPPAPPLRPSGKPLRSQPRPYGGGPRRPSRAASASAPKRLPVAGVRRRSSCGSWFHAVRGASGEDGLAVARRELAPLLPGMLAAIRR
jgi:hypothetical protein